MAFPCSIRIACEALYFGVSMVVTSIVYNMQGLHIGYTGVTVGFGGNKKGLIALVKNN